MTGTVLLLGLGVRYVRDSGHESMLFQREDQCRRCHQQHKLTNGVYYLRVKDASVFGLPHFP